MSGSLAQSGTAPPERRTGASRWLRALHNLFIFALLFVLLIDGLPTTHKGHERVKTFLDPVVDGLGLWQGNWKLFAPDPDHMNTWVEARVTYGDGSQWSWTTPDWQKRNLWEKFIQGRHPKFSDAFRLDKRKGIWPYIVDYVVRIAPKPTSGARPTRVELLRHWWDVPPPAEIDAVMEKYGTPVPARSQFEKEHSFYTKVIR